MVRIATKMKDVMTKMKGVMTEMKDVMTEIAVKHYSDKSA